MVSVACAEQSAKLCRAAGAQVELAIFQQGFAPRMKSDGFAGVRFHHLWDERWEVRDAVAAWLHRLPACGKSRIAQKDAGCSIPSLMASSLAEVSSDAEGIAKALVLLEEADL